MKPKELEQLKIKFKEEQTRWEALKIGQDVYVHSYVGLDIDVFHHVIVSINIEDRSIKALDHSQSGKPLVELGEYKFHTKEETNKLLSLLGMGQIK